MSQLPLIAAVCVRPRCLHQVTTTAKLIFSPGVFITSTEMLILFQYPHNRCLHNRQLFSYRGFSCLFKQLAIMKITFFFRLKASTCVQYMPIILFFSVILFKFVFTVCCFAFLVAHWCNKLGLISLLGATDMNSHNDGPFFHHQNPFILNLL